MKNQGELTDADLTIIVQRIAAGDEQTFRELYHLFNKRLYHFAFAIVKTRELAEEVVEDVFIKTWKRGADLLKIANLNVYLYTATKNTALNYLSRNASRNITEAFDDLDIALSDKGIDPEQILITREMYTHIQRAIEQLPPRCKMIFKLIREDGLRYKEVAEILNISVNTIDTQMAIAVKRIATAVHKHFESFPGNLPQRK
jgi:RNA polymerase sigma-70 factor (family 1)